MHRSSLHHGDYHYRFYHYLNKSGYEAENVFVKAIAAALAGTPKHCPEAVAKAFKHWPEISKSLHDLFDRAPREAITDQDAVLARMAIEEVGKGDYPESVAVMVHERAECMLAECAERNKARVEKVLKESKRLVSDMDTFVALFDSDFPHPGLLPKGTGGKFSADEAEQRVRIFLENCRLLDRELSDMPRRLRDETGA